MKTLTLFLALSLGAMLCAQEPFSQEQLKNIIPQIMERTSSLKDLPLPMDIDADKAFGMKIKEYACVALPAERFSKEFFAETSKEIYPIGQLWLSGVVPIAAGKEIAGEKLRSLKVGSHGNERTAHMLQLGIHKLANDELELVAYSRDKEPLLTVPMKKLTGSRNIPLELEMKRGTESFGIVEIHLYGQYAANLMVGQSQN